MVTAAVYTVERSQPAGRDPDSTTPGVLMISVDWVQPIGLVGVGCRKLTHGGRAIRKDLEPGRNLLGNAQLVQHFRNMDSGR